MPRYGDVRVVTLDQGSPPAAGDRAREEVALKVVGRDVRRAAKASGRFARRLGIDRASIDRVPGEPAA